MFMYQFVFNLLLQERRNYFVGCNYDCIRFSYIIHSLINADRKGLQCKTRNSAFIIYIINSFIIFVRVGECSSLYSFYEILFDTRLHNFTLLHILEILFKILLKLCCTGALFLYNLICKWIT